MIIKSCFDWMDHSEWCEFRNVTEKIYMLLFFGALLILKPVKSAKSDD